MHLSTPTLVFIYGAGDWSWRDRLTSSLDSEARRIGAQDRFRILAPGGLEAFKPLPRDLEEHLGSEALFVILLSRHSMGLISDATAKSKFSFADTRTQPILVNIDLEDSGGARFDAYGRRPLLPDGPCLARLDERAASAALDQIAREALAELGLSEPPAPNAMNAPRARHATPPGVPQPQYSSDQVDGQPDLLGINQEVEAFAWLLSAKKVTPPLSIGVFGDWGSGKSFFMRSLRRRVDDITKSARSSDQTQKEISVYKRIVQIEFNAWHYVESNLWASLVEHLFQNLKISEDEKPGSEIESRQKHLLDTLQLQEEARKRAASEVDEARREKEEAKIRLKEIVDLQSRKLERLGEVSGRDVWASVELSTEDRDKLKKIRQQMGLPELQEGAQELGAALGEMGALLHRGRSVVTTLLQTPSGGPRVALLTAFLLAGLFVGLGLDWLISHLSGPNPVSKFAAYVAGLLVTGAAGLRTQAAWVGGLVRSLEGINQRREERIASERIRQDNETARLRKEIDVLIQQQSAAEQRQRDADQRVLKTQRELEELNPATQIARLIQDRAQSDDYRKHLGLLALIRRDFETLSNLIQAQNQDLEKMDTLDQERQKEAQRVNRIVLYIDDLDRCPPDKVVDVLQAIHLLLAFPLFVVVVGVDVRWISRALELRYRRMMGDGVSERATPFQYIEKVFQLPFELGALSADARRGMTRGLLRASVVAEPAVAPSAPGPGPKPPPPPPPEWLKPPKPLSVVNDLKPASLDLFAREVEHMSRVTAGFGGSPRSIKRLTNVYRLIKTGLSRERAIQFTAERGQDSDYKAVLVLLGVATGFPGKAEDVFNSISGNSEGLGFPPTLQLALQRGLGAAVWSGLAVQPDTMQVVGESSLAAVARWSDKVRRYSFPE